MRYAAIAMVLATGCGGEWFEWEARAVIGVEPQHVPVAALGPAGPMALWFSVRTDDLDVVYPLRISGTEVMLDSAFDGTAISSTYDPYYADTAQRPRPGSLAIDLHGPFPQPDPAKPPGDQPFAGTFELSILGGAMPARVGVQLAPTFDPCGYQWPVEGVPPIPANALPVTATCFDGTSCVSPGVPFAQTPTSVVVPPFVIRIYVQTSCSESTG